MATLILSNMRLILKSRIWILAPALLMALVVTSATVSASIINEEVVKSVGADGSGQTRPTNRCNMNMPGFNTDASAYRTNGRYYMRGAPVQVSGTLRPAQQTCTPECIGRCESACRSDGNSQSFCQKLCSSDCEAYGPPCSPSPEPTYPTPWVCEPDPVSPNCEICRRMLSPDIGQTRHVCSE